MRDEDVDTFLRELIAIEKRAIVSGGLSSAARLRDVEKLVDNWFKEIGADEAQEN